MASVSILRQQPLSFQAATCSLADQLNQIPQLVFNRRFDALESRGPVVAIDVYAIQKQGKPVSNPGPMAPSRVFDLRLPQTPVAR